MLKSIKLPRLPNLSHWLPNAFSTARRPSYVAKGASSTSSDAVDLKLVWYALLLLVAGLVMVYSATIALPDSPRFQRLSSTHFLVRHVIAICVALLCAVAVFSQPTERLQKVAPILFLLGMCGLILVLIPGIGKAVLGARRWLSFGPINLQPSELMKLFVILYAADYAVRKQEVLHRFKEGFLPMAIAMSIVAFLLIREPDMGACIVMLTIAFGILFLGGLNIKLLAALGVTLIAVFAALVWFTPFRRQRIFAYLDPFAENNALDKGYQLTHSLIAFGRGEWTGVGLGGSVEKLYYLPEAHTDFLLAVIGEELGLVGVLFVVLMFFLITRKSFEIGRQAMALERYFNGLMAKGVGLFIGGQALFNMSVNVGLLPTKGLTLPLMSYGGTGLVVNCVAIALLLRVDFENRQMMRGKRTT